MNKKIFVGFADAKIKQAFLALKNGKGAEPHLYEYLDRAFDDFKATRLFLLSVICYPPQLSALVLPNGLNHLSAVHVLALDLRFLRAGPMITFLHLREELDARAPL